MFKTAVTVQNPLKLFTRSQGWLIMI